MNIVLVLLFIAVVAGLRHTEARPIEGGSPEAEKAARFLVKVFDVDDNGKVETQDATLAELNTKISRAVINDLYRWFGYWAIGGVMNARWSVRFLNEIIQEPLGLEHFSTFFLKRYGYDGKISREAFKAAKLDEHSDFDALSDKITAETLATGDDRFGGWLDFFNEVFK